MAGLSGNSSDKQVLKNVVVITGLVNAKVLAINPSKEELEKHLEISLEKEPSYKGITIKDASGNEKMYNKISFLLEANPTVKYIKDGAIVREPMRIVRSMDILVRPVEETASTGTKKLINGKGATTWGNIENVKANEKMKWFTKDEPITYCYEGQETITNFFREFLNMDPKADVIFADIEKIINGDVAELKGYLKNFPKNEVTVYMDVKDDGDKVYQQVYQNCFSRPTSKNAESKFAKRFSEQYGKPKCFSGSFEPTLYSQVKVDSPDNEAASNTAAAKRSDFV